MALTPINIYNNVMKKIYWIGGIVIILLLGAWYLVFRHPRVLWAVADAGKHMECERKGGDWVWAHTFLERGYCNHTFADGGKPCITNDECQDDCFLPGFDPANATQRDANGYLIGKCVHSTETKGTGCFLLASMPEPVTEPPMYATCIDSF